MSIDGTVSLQRVCVRLGGRPVLTGIDLAASPGQMLALAGPSGAGKTTLLRLLNRGVRPESGRVTVGGVDLDTVDPAGLRRIRAGIGFIHQDLRLVPSLRVDQNVMSGGFGRQTFLQSLRTILRPPRESREKVHRLLELVGVPEKMFVRVDRLSGGQAQRVAIARALYQDPAILLADEPIASVDPARARDLFALLTDICRARGLTLLVSSHDPDLVRCFFPRVIGLRRGRILLDRPTGELSAADLARLYDLEAGHET